MKKNGQVNIFRIFGFSLVLSLAVAVMISCGGSNNPTTATNGTVNVSMTDPATCGFEFKNVYVTVTKVMANINADAGPNDSNWQTLVDLTKNPMQIDLLSLADPTQVCLLKKLGASAPLPAGKYQQIRLYLQSNSTSNSGSACGAGNGWNCVVTQSGTTAELQLPSEVQTGIKIPSTNITSGGLTVTAGQSVDLNIDFQSCASVVQEGNGMYRLKPVLFAGEVTKNMNSISGQVVEGDSKGQPVLNSSNQPTPVGGAIVLFEHPDKNGNEVVMESTTTDSSGNFFVCPLQGANYDIAVTAQTSGSSGTTTYNPTVAFDVPLGTNLGQVPLVPETLSTVSTGGAGSIAGQVDTDTTTTGEAVTLTPTMSLTPSGGTATNVVIPVFTVNGTALLANGQPPSVMTTSAPTPSSPACSTGSDCYNFTLTVPASNPNVGTYDSGAGAITYGGPGSGSVTYGLTAASGGCSGGTATDSSLVVTPDNTPPTAAQTLSLTSCN